MNNPNTHLSTLQDIKQMMEKSSRFISLSGLSGVAAGICALIGAAVSYDYVYGYKDYIIDPQNVLFGHLGLGLRFMLNTWLFWIAAITFVAALVSAFFFTWLKSKKEGVPLWGKTAQRLLAHVSIPLLAGGLFILKLIHFDTFGLIAPGCLIFYGLALLNGSKFTLSEVKYLAYGQIILGIINLEFVGYGLYFWATGFGILHIVYGIVMWNKYDRATIKQ